MESIVNDNYCDLPNGSDETRTAACSYISKLYFECDGGKKIFMSRIDDGVCDCIDGSDEINSPFHPNCGHSVVNIPLPLQRRRIRTHTINAHRKFVHQATPVESTHLLDTNGRTIIIIVVSVVVLLIWCIKRHMAWKWLKQKNVALTQ